MSSTKDIREAVEAELTFAPLVDATDISVHYRDDAQLTSAANNALTWAVTVPAGVEATARNGSLTLTGTVRFGSQRTAAEIAVGGLGPLARPSARWMWDVPVIRQRDRLAALPGGTPPPASGGWQPLRLAVAAVPELVGQ